MKISLLREAAKWKNCIEVSELRKVWRWVVIWSSKRYWCTLCIHMKFSSRWHHFLANLDKLFVFFVEHHAFSFCDWQNLFLRVHFASTTKVFVLLSRIFALFILMTEYIFRIIQYYRFSWFQKSHNFGRK